MLKCSVCGSEVDENVQFCQNCGTKIDKSALIGESQNQPDLNNDSQNHSVQNQNQPAQNQNTKFCQNCGAKIDINAEICPKCGVRVAGSSEVKSPILALILSFFLPGLGQFYNGHSKKGIILLVAAIISIILYVILIGALLYLIIWIYGLYDAYKSAEAINKGINVPDEISLNF